MCYKTNDLSCEMFKNCPSNYARMRLAIEKKISSKNSSQSFKDDGKSNNFRNCGNKKFSRKQFEDAILDYNMAIRYAKTKEVLSMALANRSACLFHMQLHESCLRDIDMALVEGYPKELAFKLLQRACKCCKALGHKDAYFQAYFNKFKDHLKYIKDGEKVLGNLEKELKEVTLSKNSIDEGFFSDIPSLNNNRNAKFPSLSKSVKVCYTEEYGRYIAAATDLECGELIVVEKPYAKTLLTDCTSSHCDYCLQQSFNLIPCKDCPDVLFCSLECQTNAQTYHKYLCTYLEYLRNAGVDRAGLLAAYLVSRKPLTYFINFKVEYDDKKYNFLPTFSNDSDIDYVYEWNSYQNIFSLKTNEENRSEQDLLDRIKNALIITDVFEKSGYFESQLNNENKSWIGGIILTHLQNFPCNAHSIHEEILTPGSSAISTELAEIGCGIYATLRFLGLYYKQLPLSDNHSLLELLNDLLPI
ncbi:DgyrCDS13323 [Dimorphilus gyrociliatus]|uniref:DgyrCDS13323 n=1 Tax=Dimorphilus gyrociliatus TaxID=2664684 RepID=A0A7I8WAA9_9ANNE|nr:DgyrCDS13323 [Dimorphilus gyrociliatus]